MALTFCCCGNESSVFAQTQNSIRNSQTNLNDQSSSSTTSSPRLASLQPYEGATANVRKNIAKNKLAFRITWGGGAARTWQVTISVENGAAQLINPLGLDPSVPGSIFQDGNVLRVESTRPSTFGGLDFETSGNLDDSLTLDFFCNESPDVRFHRVITLRELTRQVLATSLDDDGNRISLQRKPGDQLHLEMNRQSLVFEPGEPFQFSVMPRLGTAMPKGNSLRSSSRLRVQLLSARSDRVIWSTEYSSTIDELGDFKPFDGVEVPLPEKAGAYDIRLTLTTRSMRNWNSPEYQREVQVIVVDSVPNTESQAVLWSEVSRFAVADTLPGRAGDWRQRFTELSGFSGRSNRSPPGNAISNENHSLVDFDKRELVELAPRGWMAIPLPTVTMGRPHIVEIEYLHRGPMRLGISILQPDANNQIPHYGADSGLVIPESALLPEGLEEPTIQKHRVVFWPRHRSPLLLFANRDGINGVAIGKVRILAGPNDLAGSTATDRTEVGRKYMAYLEKPLFNQQFDATKWLETNSGQLLDDWQTFEEGTSRLVQHLKANGYTGMALTVLSDGSSLYPSQLMSPTPRYDNGAFWPTGKDVMRKDVLELLFRICNREQIELMPVLELTTPIPELERLRQLNPIEANGIDLVDVQGQRVELNLEDRFASYNPLDSRVQQATLKVVEELSARYGHHSAFAGLGIKLSPESLLPLPGPQWGLSTAVIKQFSTELGIDPATWEAEEPAAVRQQILANRGNEWLDWRAKKIASFTDQIQRTISKHHLNAKLMLIPVDIYQVDEIRASINPTPKKQPDLAKTMLHMGFSLEEIRKNPNVEFLQPNRFSLDDELANNRLNIHSNQESHTKNVFAGSGNGQLFLHRHRWSHFAQLQKVKPFGDQRSDLHRIQPLSPAGFWNRQRFAKSLFAQDSKTILDGGWLLPTGQNSSIGGAVDTFTQLPAVDFLDVPPVDERGIHKAIAVRQFKSTDAQYFYVSNPNPWKVRCQLNANISEPLIMLANRNEDLVVNSENLIEFDLAPFEIVGAKIESNEFEISSYSASVDDKVLDALRRQLDRLQSKVSRASQAKPWAVLKNESFEPGDNGNREKAWPIDSQIMAFVKFSKISDAKTGEYCLSLHCEDRPAFIRSHEIPTPITGRLSITAWIRTADNNSNPPLNISIDAYHRGRPFYRYASVGELQKPTKDQPNWRKIAVHFEDLPTSDLTNLKIGFDLMGPGRVQVDDVRIFDRWFDEQDAALLTQRFALASYRLKNEGDIKGCREVLEQYWAQFFNHYFPDQSAPNQKKTVVPKEARLPAESDLQADAGPSPLLEQIKSAPQRIFQRD